MLKKFDRILTIYNSYSRLSPVYRMNSVASKRTQSSKNQPYWSIVWRSIAPKKETIKMNKTEIDELRKTLTQKKLSQIKAA